MDRNTFEASLRAEGYEIVTNAMRPNAVNAEHAHGFDARLLVVEGAMTIIRDGAPTRTYQAGETFEMTAGCRHSETAGDAGASYIAGRRAPAASRQAPHQPREPEQSGVQS
jgi:quercetin dioxygenase-like cupin family protein